MPSSANKSELEPNVDAYGTHARVAALADFLEVAALDGSRLSRGHTEDYIGDLSWQSLLLKDTYVYESGDAESNGGFDEEPDSASEEAAGRVFDLLQRRSLSLREQYPFSVDTEIGWLERRDPECSPYLALLGITVSHAFRIVTGLQATSVFEDTVARALTDAGHLSLNFSSFRSGHSGFHEALVAAGPALNLQPTPFAAPTSAMAQDAGGDVLGQIDTGYLPGSSTGAWTFVGQATCGTSDSWQRKVGEVQIPAWKDRLGSVVPPLAFLAVPHHADHASNLVISSATIVLDRVRLVSMLRGVSEDERQVFEVVMSTPTTRAFCA